MKRDGPILSLDSTPITEFYRDSTVFVTGATGFMGKVLIEKLLRTCKDIKTVYVLVRPKKGKDINTRFEELFNEEIFQRLNKEEPKFIHKLVPVPGDCSSRGLGLSEGDRQKLVEEVNVVFHAAATVRFDEKLRLAVGINVLGTKDIMELSKQMTHIKAVVHISTAYSNCPYKEIEERLYEAPVDQEKLIKCMESMDDELLEALTPVLIDKWPNTYAFTKAIAEDSVKRYRGHVPTAIFRPSIVIATSKEPVVGWIDNFYGPTGVVAGAGTGFLRSLHCDKDVLADMVPVDMAINAVISTAWSTANSRSNDLKVYNYVSSCENPITWGRFMQLNMQYGLECPSLRSIWYYSFTLNKSRAIHLLYILLLHIIPALLVDVFAFLLGKKIRMLKVYQKIHRFSDVISYFCMKDWKFTNKNIQDLWKELTPEDQNLFHFNIRELDWNKYFQTYITGCRRYLIKEDPKTIPEAKKRWRRLYWLHRSVQLVFLLLAFKLCTYVLQSTVAWTQ